MAFGNPYGELWHEDIVSKWGEKLSVMGIETIALSDTIGVSNPDNISRLFTQLITEHSNVEWELIYILLWKVGERRLNQLIIAVVVVLMVLLKVLVAVLWRKTT